MHKERTIRTATAIAAFGAIAALGAAGGVISSKNLSAASALSAPAVSESRALPGSFAPVVERVAPAVVSIRVTGSAESERMTSNAPEMEVPEPFKRFFGEEFGKNFGFRFGQPERQGRAPRVQGMGSGFFIDADGHVVTNNHVVASADRIEIVLKDGETFAATLVGRDPKTDLALLKVKSDKAFPFVSFGDSAAAKVGDWVIAVGSPFGLGHTATTGIVSARGRDIGAGPYDDFLQIDAPINKGNSGGPTFNVRGEVIGVNTAIISPTGVSAGIGFAVPSNMAKQIVDQLKDKGTVARGWLGVHIQAVTKDLATGLALAKPEGALVSSVTADGPAARAGLKQGDVIVAVGDERIENLRQLPRLIAGIRTGDTAKLRIVRDGSEKTVEVVIGKMPETDRVAAAADEYATPPAKLGMRLAALDDGL
ncbi:MAG: Do family serine endopeptidase, partial [Alphaproteobacteria bacterium]